MLGLYPKIVPIITSTELGAFQLHLSEEWPDIDKTWDDVRDDGYGSEDTLWIKADWCNEKLKNCPGCTKVAFDRWDFQDLYQLEKFITLYQLTWQT